MREAHNSKFKTQNSKFKIARSASRNNSKIKIQNSKLREAPNSLAKKL